MAPINEVSRGILAATQSVAAVRSHAERGNEGHGALSQAALAASWRLGVVLFGLLAGAVVRACAPIAFGWGVGDGRVRRTHRFSDGVIQVIKGFALPRFPFSAGDRTGEAVRAGGRSRTGGRSPKV